MTETRETSDGTKSSHRGWNQVSVRLAVLAALLAAGLALVTGLKASTWRELARLQDDFAARRMAVSHLGLRLQSEFERANLELLSGRRSEPDSEGPLTFHQRMQAAQQQLARSLGMLSTARELESAQRLAAAVDQYQHDVQPLLEQGRKPVRKDSAAQLAAQLDQISLPLRSACQEFIEVQEAAWTGFLNASETAARRLQTTALITVVTQLLLVCALAVLLHRIWVVPLQARLSASHQSLERQEKLAALGTLAAGVAHEIRNPLTAIKFRLFSLKKAMPPPLLDNDDLQVIASEVNRLERITKGFLLFARPSEPEFAPVDAGSLLQEVADLLGADLARRAISLVRDAGPEVVVRGDRQQLLQVLINLTQNAAESIDRNGTITWRARMRVARRERRLVHLVTMEITDTGPGIPPEVRERLFDPFYSTKAGGTGLGLSIAERIVSKHGGVLEYQTSSQGGAMFLVTLPAEALHESKHTDH